MNNNPESAFSPLQIINQQLNGAGAGHTVHADGQISFLMIFMIWTPTMTTTNAIAPHMNT